MLNLGVQTQGVIEDENPEDGFAMLSRTGFSCADFSLHSYLVNKDIYQSRVNDFFDAPIGKLEEFFCRINRRRRHMGVPFIKCICHIQYMCRRGTGR